MYSLVPFEIMVPVEALRALIALERSIVVRSWLMMPCVQLVHLCTGPAVVSGHDVPGQPMVWHAEHRHLPARRLHIRDYRSADGGQVVEGIMPGKSTAWLLHRVLTP